MNREQLGRYLDRIGFVGEPQADAAGLERLQRAHLETVPFENLDIIEGRIPLRFDEEALFDKVVVKKRGGICYELNLLFAAALRAVGFDVALKGARHPKYGDDADHLFLLVRVPDDADLRIADVGFAYNFAKPLRFVEGVQQNDGRDRYRVEAAPDLGRGYVRLMREQGLSGEVESTECYAFGPVEFGADDFRERCDWYSTSPESRFTQGPLVCIDGESGRRTLSAHHVVVTAGGQRIVQDIESGEQFSKALHELFNL